MISIQKMLVRQRRKGKEHMLMTLPWGPCAFLPLEADTSASWVLMASWASFYHSIGHSHRLRRHDFNICISQPFLGQCWETNLSGL